MRKLLAPVMALSLYACGSEQANERTPLNYMSPSKEAEMIQKEIDQNPRRFVETYGNAANVGSRRFGSVVRVATRKNFVLEDPTYDKLVDAIEAKYPGYVACYTEYPAGVRGQECKKSIEELQMLHSQMNGTRTRAKKSVRPVKKIPELSYY